MMLEPPSAAAFHRHPQANRSVRLAGAMVDYRLRRTARRSIGFSVRPEGLVVSAPLWLPQSAIEAALARKADWIVRKLAEVRERAARANVARIVWRDRALLPFGGRSLTLKLDPALGSRGAARLESAGGAGATMPVAQNMVAECVLRIALPADAPPHAVERAVKTFLLAEARRVFEQRLAHFAPQLGVQWHRLSLGNAATRWGSARADGSIRLHWRLIQLDLELLDYVVVHELAHLRHMDHSARFWAVVAGVLPDHEELRARLRRVTLPRWD